MTADTELKIELPGSGYDFATLQHAQTLGDFRALTNKNRRIVRVRISGDLNKGLKTLSTILK